MKRIFLLLLTAAVLSCQPESKQEAKVQEKVGLAHEPEEKEKSQPAYTCSDGYEHHTFTLGKGLIQVNSDSGNNSSSFDLYNDSLLQDKYISWDYYKDAKPAKVICPKYFNLEPDVIQFVYVRETPKAYQVINGYDEIKYLPKVKENVAVSWQDYILYSFGVSRLTAAELKETVANPVRKMPSENAATLTFPQGPESLCPMEIKGDWLKVQYDCFSNLEQNEFEGRPCHEFIQKCKPAQTGWIKWREKNKILIGISLMP